ncbi:hypothetical protein AGMMS49949_03560 [Alphaproteobacteria bacterium]|nr:hypothetical protein AGMMS49949_03560 [Alphaproteobacteria bacterium]GHS96746.1 hypothetical protein AGMMS50296_3140 [Alphaproteobacteria bacterium]
MKKTLKTYLLLSSAFFLSRCAPVKTDDLEKSPVVAEKKVEAKKVSTPVVEAAARKAPAADAQKPTALLKAVSKQGQTAEDLVLQAEKLYYGLNGPTDIKKGLKLLTKAAEKGSGYACRRMGLEYSDFAFNDLTPRDDKKARAWFEKGAGLGDSESVFYLSEFYFEGRGGAKDSVKATELLIRAARMKSRAAAHRVVKLAKKGAVTISESDKRDFYILDKQLRDSVTLSLD